MPLTQWSDDGDQSYTGSPSITYHRQLPGGLYDVRQNIRNDPVMTRVEVKDEQLHVFQYGPMKPVMVEISSFWDRASHFRRLGVVHKRGILLHGPAGCGKTGIIQSVVKDVIEIRQGVAVRITSPQVFREVAPAFRQIESERPLLGIIEDIDAMLPYAEEELLEMLDGSTMLGHGILFLCTTNKLKEIPIRIRCRQSRIDTLLEVPLPDEKQRYEYLRFICKGEFHRKPAELMKWAAQSKGLSLASVKELVIATVVFEKPLRETLARLKELSKET